MTTSTTRAAAAAGVSTTLVVTGMHCACCVGHVERALVKFAGVSARVELAAATAVVHHPATVPVGELMAAVRDVGYTAEPAG
jgi:Cu+-exporting ATPase